MTLRVTPFGLLPCPVTSAANPGLYGSLSQPVNSIGAEAEPVPPSSPRKPAEAVSGEQLVGLNWKPLPFGSVPNVSTLVCLSCTGTPLRTWGTVSTNVGTLVLTVTCA